jgi:hypothetical protein
VQPSLGVCLKLWLFCGSPPRRGPRHRPERLEHSGDLAVVVVPAVEGGLGNVEVGGDSSDAPALGAEGAEQGALGFGVHSFAFFRQK